LTLRRYLYIRSRLDGAAYVGLRENLVRCFLHASEPSNRTLREARSVRDTVREQAILRVQTQHFRADGGFVENIGY